MQGGEQTDLSTNASNLTPATLAAAVPPVRMLLGLQQCCSGHVLQICQASD